MAKFNEETIKSALTGYVKRAYRLWWCKAY